jgi:CheY-like chemotaxis protein
MINEITSLINARIASKPIDFRILVDDKLPSVLYGDQMRVKQIIINLLTNAVKYTNEGRILFQIKADNVDDICNLTISVQDTGIGMTDAAIEKIFSKYERFDLKNNVHIEGTGLGMIIVKSLIELMDGNINVNSVEGKGSNFIINIPFRHTIDSYEYDLDVNVLKDKHILVVEDYEINQLILGEFLKYANISFDFANNGLEAVNLVEKNSYDAILMDIQMPEMDGYDATLKIRENNNDIPIIAISADAFIEDIEKMKSYGMNDHVSKPIERDKLFSVLTKFFI